MAADLAAPRAEPRARSVLLQRTAAVPAWVWLTGLVVASFGGRLLAAAGRLVPDYLPDEYIYPSLARSFAEHGRPLIRGAGAHFPALLEPLVTAPIWLVTKDPHTAWRLTQGLHALIVSLAAIPAYLLARRVGVSRGLALGVGAIAVAVPDTIYASEMLADPLAYPLVLGAFYAGICVIVDPSRRAQFAFVVLSALSIFARLEFAIVPVAVLIGALAADRGRVLLTAKKLWPSLIALGAPSALALAIFPHRAVGPYAHALHTFAPVSIVQWVARDAMLFAYSTGWVIVPGALVGLAYALLRPRNRAEIGFAVTTLVLAVGLLVEAAQIAGTDSQRFQERYVFALVPLLAIAFGLYVKRGLPAKLFIAAISTGLLLLAARVPLSGYAAAHGHDDSPTLWAVVEIEAALTTGNGALGVALLAALLSGLAALVAWRRAGGMLALVVAVAACCALSAGASSFDAASSSSLRQALPHDLRWIDHARLGDVDLVAPPGARREQSWEALFWNLSAKRLLLLGSPAPDQFAVGHLRVSADGTMLLAGRPLDRPFAVQTYASLLQLTGVRLVRHELVWDLYRPEGTPRVQLIAAGRYYDHWLASRGAITVWTHSGGTLHLRLSLPRGLRVTTMHLGSRTIRLHPGERLALGFAVPARTWSLHYWTPRPAYLADRSVSVVADVVRFTGR